MASVTKLGKYDDPDKHRCKLPNYWRVNKHENDVVMCSCGKAYIFTVSRVMGNATHWGWEDFKGSPADVKKA